MAVSPAMGAEAPLGPAAVVADHAVDPNTPPPVGTQKRFAADAVEPSWASTIAAKHSDRRKVAQRNAVRPAQAQARGRSIKEIMVGYSSVPGVRRTGRQKIAAI